MEPTNSSLLPNGTDGDSTVNSTFGAPIESVNIPSIVFLSVLIPLVCAGNLLVCVVFIKYQRLRTATNCFLFSLAISDLAVGIVLIPFWITLVLMSLKVDGVVLKTYVIIDITCSVSSMANLASVSMERWYGVTYPFRHMSISPKKASIMAACSWLYGFCTSLLYLTAKDWVFTLLDVFGLFLPFLVMIVCYCGIALRIRKRSAVASSQSGRECKAIRTLLLITFLYLICWLPFIVGSIITNHCLSCAQYVSARPFLRTFAILLHYFNSCINPVLYALLSPSFKSAYRQLFFGVRLTRANGQIGTHQHRSSLEPSNTRISVIKKPNVIFLEKDKMKNISLNGHNNNNVLISPDRESAV